VWKNFGYNMLIFIAGLQAVPEELYEAAYLDGAGPWHRFRHVTLPMLGPTLLFVGLITMIGFTILYGALAFVMLGLVVRRVRHGLPPATADTGFEHEAEPALGLGY